MKPFFLPTAAADSEDEDDFKLEPFKTLRQMAATAVAASIPGQLFSRNIFLQHIAKLKVNVNVKYFGKLTGITRRKAENCAVN